MTLLEDAALPIAHAAVEGPAPVAEVRGLYKRYGRGDVVTEALLGVDLRVLPGQIIGVLGPNGAGKTTLVSVLEGLTAPDAGHAFVMGHDVTDRRMLVRHRERMGVTMQNGVLPPLVKVRELLQFKAAMHRQPRDIDDLLQALGMDGKQQALYRALSGGEQQRVVMAMALVGCPDLLFLDEPTSQLDPQGRRTVWDILMEERRRGCACLVTTHQMDEAERLCDRVAVLDHGKVIAEGTPHELIAAHCPERHVEFATTIAHAATLPTGYTQMDLHRHDGLVTLRATHDRIEPALFDLAARQAAGTLHVQDLHIVSQSLEDVFIKLTGRSIR